MDLFTWVYIKPYCRVTTYAIGLLLGYFILQCRHKFTFNSVSCVSISKNINNFVNLRLFRISASCNHSKYILFALIIIANIIYEIIMVIKSSLCPMLTVKK